MVITTHRPFFAPSRTFPREIARLSWLIIPNTWVKGHRQLDEVQLVIVLSRRLVRDDDDDDHKRSSVVLYEPMQLITLAI